MSFLEVSSYAGRSTIGIAEVHSATKGRSKVTAIHRLH